MPRVIYKIKTEKDLLQLKRGIESQYLVVGANAEADRFGLDEGSLEINYLKNTLDLFSPTRKSTDEITSKIESETGVKLI